MSIAENIKQIKSEIHETATLVAVSKTKPNEAIIEAYNSGQRIFGENKVQELVQKHEDLPKDIEWHLIGHLQTNKVKYIAPFVSLIHAVDSIKLLKEINKQALKNNRVIDCLLQVKIAEEESKFGLSKTEALAIINSEEIQQLKNINIVGLMGMATNSSDESQVKSEFKLLSELFTQLSIINSQLSILSMGMSNDYKLALNQGSNMIRVGSTIFGDR
ncbi:MAG: YggS family pyridoxal phosphate-dependent enzyme [Flavobacteriales bacterium]|nr:MAG: YggS family pyridoxal phosphate-dependent enzyme [Flavobacteriales bacterium]